MKQTISTCVNPAESDAMWKVYKRWFNYYINFVQELSYGVVSKGFSERFLAAMEPIAAMLKEEEEAKAAILRLPAPNRMLLLEGPKKDQVETSGSTTLSATPNINPKFRDSFTNRLDRRKKIGGGLDIFLGFESSASFFFVFSFSFSVLFWFPLL
jgi:hypothetical protein